MKTVGDKDRFALAFELRPDPDSAGSAELRASWAALQIWVAGRNLTQGTTASGEAVDVAEVPLAPIVRWLIEAWDPLLHEERLPLQSRTSSAARFRLDSLARLPDDELELDALLEAREAWWHHHGLGSALPDYRIPDLHIRRSGDDVEISWDDREWRSVRGGVRLTEQPGQAFLPAEEVAKVLYEWASAVVTEIGAGGEALEFAFEMSNELAKLSTPGSMLERLKYAAGQRLADVAAELRRLAGVIDGSVEETMRSLLGLDDDQTSGLIAPLTVPVMLYRSASPALTSSDLMTLLRLSRDLESGTAALEQLQSPERPPLSAEEITQDGCDKALEFRSASAIPLDACLLEAWDLEKQVLRGLGVIVEDIHLDDTGVDGVAIARRGRAPVIAVNRSGRFSSTPWGRRMTLAHELCHLLFDVSREGRVGLVSNSWAPYSLERRANAFAAMLLAPPAALKELLPGDPDQWTTGALEAAMHALGVGKSTLTWQLYNLRWITASEREAWLDAL